MSSSTSWSDSCEREKRRMVERVRETTVKKMGRVVMWKNVT